MTLTRHAFLGLAGSRCDSFACRYSVRCREFRGLRRFFMPEGERWYCWRHVPKIYA
jgi:hypothetical protein